VPSARSLPSRWERCCPHPSQTWTRGFPTSGGRASLRRAGMPRRPIYSFSRRGSGRAHCSRNRRAALAGRPLERDYPRRRDRYARSNPVHGYAGLRCSRGQPLRSDGFSPGLTDTTSAARRGKGCSRSGSCCRFRPSRAWRWPRMIPRLYRMNSGGAGSHVRRRLISSNSGAAGEGGPGAIPPPSPAKDAQAAGSVHDSCPISIGG
jgi:hypothetical protein